MLTKNFLQKIINIWQEGKVKYFDNFYAFNVTGRLNQEIDLSYKEIKNRFIYVSKHNINRAFDIKESVIENNKAALLFCYTAYDTQLKIPIKAPTLWLFTIKEEKIIHVEILTSLRFNYHNQS